MPGIFVSWESQGGIQHVCRFMYVLYLPQVPYVRDLLAPSQCKQDKSAKGR